MIRSVSGKNKQLAQDIARAFGAGKPLEVETVDFANPNRPKTCLEMDSPILPINQIAAIEGKGSGVLKPIYQMSKWWARCGSSVFRSMLIVAARRLPLLHHGLPRMFGMSITLISSARVL